MHEIATQPPCQPRVAEISKVEFTLIGTVLKYGQYFREY